jgi:AAA domain
MNKDLVDGLIASMQDLETRPPYFKGMIYGESGVGKTILAFKIAQAITPKDQYIAYIDTVEGWVSALNHKEEHLLNRCKRFKYQGLSQIAALVEAIDTGVEPFNEIGCLIVDEASTVSRLDLDVALKARARTTQDKDIDSPTWPDMNINTHRMRLNMLDLLAKDFHVILTSHVREDTDKRTGKVYTRPDFMPQISKSIREMVHLVGHMTASISSTEDGEAQYNRSIQVYPTDHIVAKTRVGGMGLDATSEELCIAIPEWIKGDREDLDNNTPLKDTDTLVPDENSSESDSESVEEDTFQGVVVP